jgi:geranylgeranyl pyrophosphate synthase
MSLPASGDSIALVRATPGLTDYLQAVEERLEAGAGKSTGAVGEAALQSLKAGGKRLRPLLVFLSASDPQAPVAAGVAVELVHLASLVHDDLLDRATLRRGRPSTWSAFGERAAVAGGDFLFARAFAELAAEQGVEALELLAQAALELARGEALEREQRFDAETSIDDYLERCSLKTGALFSAACRLGADDAESRLGAYGSALGIAFQIVDDVLDCSGETPETGKTAGTDLRAGVPTLPLLIAAERDPVVRDALAGGPCEGALVRIAASGALDRCLEIARDYARRACGYLDGRARAKELEALTRVVVERRR